MSECSCQHIMREREREKRGDMLPATGKGTFQRFLKMLFENENI